MEIFDLYDISRSYIITEFYSLDSAVLLAIIRDKAMNVTETLRYIPHIHNAYIEVILANRESNSGE